MSEHIKELDLDALDAVSAGDCSELGQTESMRLQMAMDRVGKFISTLSNILRSIGDTGSQITRNLK